MYIRSPAADRALQSIHWLDHNSHLATCNMSNYLGAFLSGPGASEESIQKQAVLYKAFKDEQLDKHAHEPKGEGALMLRSYLACSGIQGAKK